MLIMTRSHEDAVGIFDKKTGELLVTVKILGIMGRQVRMGFEADKTRFDIVRDNAKNREAKI